MAEQVLLTKKEQIPVFQSDIFKEPKNANELRFKTLKGIELTEDDIWYYNEDLGQQAQDLAREIRERLAQIKLELKEIKEIKEIKNSHINSEQKHLHFLQFAKLSNEQDELWAKEELITPEMLRLIIDDE